MAAAISHLTDISEEDELRARFYGLLAALLAKPADAEMLGRLSKIEGDETDIGIGLRALANVARATAPEAVETEFNNLFIGIGKGELVPFGSYYLTGFLNESHWRNSATRWSITGYRGLMSCMSLRIILHRSAR